MEDGRAEVRGRRSEVGGRRAGEREDQQFRRLEEQKGKAKHIEERYVGRWKTDDDLF